MRALLFLAVAATLIYKFYPSFNKKEAADTLALKMSSVRREVVKIQTEEEVRAPAVVERFTATPAKSKEVSQPLVAETKKNRPDPHTADSELGAVAQWNTELKEFLAGVEPEEGEEMYNKYLAEREAFQSEFNNLANERANLYADESGKANKKLYRKNRELIEEYDHLMSQLEMKHAEKLKDVLGAHYDQVQEMQGQYNDSLREEILESDSEAAETSAQ